MKRLFLTAMAVFAVSAMFVSCNKQEESSEDDGTKYALFFNYGTDSHVTSETPVLSDILNKAKELTVEADIALYGGTKKEYPFVQELSAKTEKDAKAEYNKLVEKAKSEGAKIIAELNKMKEENAAAIAEYPKDMHVNLDFGFMLLKYTPEIIGGETIAETDCGKFEVAGSK
ncbi:MAG: hypothetical protein PUC61_01005 [Bacteroidales bacterium]|nr:hypothetical protein [Bacteroidales bacterium]